MLKNDIFDCIKEKLGLKKSVPTKVTHIEIPVVNYIDGEETLEIDWEEGTKKQQTWANKIVKEFMKEAKQNIDDAVKEGAITEEQANDIKKALNKNIIYQDDANWWIDNQDKNFRKKLIEITAPSEELEKIMKKVAY